MASGLTRHCCHRAGAAEKPLEEETIKMSYRMFLLLLTLSAHALTGLLSTRH